MFWVLLLSLGGFELVILSDALATRGVAAATAGAHAVRVQRVGAGADKKASRKRKLEQKSAFERLTWVQPSENLVV